MAIEVSVEPFKAMQQTAAGPAEVTYDMDRVYAVLIRGKTHVGWLPHKGNRVLFLAPTDERGEFFLLQSQKEEINQTALALRDGAKTEPVVEAE